MLSKNNIKLVNSLRQKKIRQQLGLFVVEGIKGINEFLSSEYELEQLYATETVFSVEYTKITKTELQKISTLKSPNKALAVFRMPALTKPKLHGLILGLDDLRDPGNLGTIIRLCDWYGVNHIICSQSTVDCYNPKVVQATMGSLTRVNLHYQDLNKFLEEYKFDICGTFLKGDNIYKEHLPENTVIIMGNEANGISSDIERLVNKRLNIPQFGIEKETESLNVAAATAIVLSEFRRRSL